MNAENGKMFRSALSGYNKDDVNRYILENDRKNREEKSKLANDIEDMGKFNVELAAKNEQLTEQAAELKARCEEMESELARLKEVLNEKEALLLDLTKRHDFYKTQTEAQNDVLAKAKEEKAALSRRLSDLEEVASKKDEQIKANAEKYAKYLATLRQGYETEIKKATDAAKMDDGVAYKLNMYDKISSQIGDILINANRNSDEIIRTAKQKAERLLKETDATASENAARMKNGISDSAEQAMQGIREDLAGSMNSCAEELQACITEIQYETDTFLALLEKKQTEINDRLSFYHAGITDAVKDRLATLDADYDSIIGTEK